MKKTISTEKAPAAVGPYSQARLCDGTLYVSCQLAIDPAVGKLIDGDVKAQTRQILDNVKNILAEADMTLSDVVKTTAILKDMESFPEFNATYAEFFGNDAPARTCISAILPLGALIGIDFIASK